MITRWLFAIALCVLLVPTVSTASTAPSLEDGLAIAEDVFIDSLAEGTHDKMVTSEDDAKGASRAFISVSCSDGSTISCNGSYVHGRDAACPNQRGYCYGSSTDYRYCPRCPPPNCPSSTPCSNYYGSGGSCSPDGSQRACTYFNGDCGTCYCIGGFYWDCV